MIVLRYPTLTPKIQAIEERLKSISLDYLIQVSSRLKKVEMEDGKQLFVGEDAINKELNNLEEEAKQWWYCS